MEKSFDLVALLRINQKKHKSKPAQFTSVAHGVQKRLESNIERRRSIRLTLFDHARNITTTDHARNITTCETPEEKTEMQTKLEHRKQQLAKWKEDKEKKKKELAAMKKKPFVVGIVPAPLAFVGPPPVPRPGTSRRVTRSQTLKSTNKGKQNPRQTNTKSFAPINAPFRPPEFRSIPPNSKLPTLAPVKPPTKSNVFSKTSGTKTSIKVNSKTYNKSTKSNGSTKPLQQSSSGSDMEATSNIAIAYDLSSPEEPVATKPIMRIQTPGHVKNDRRKTMQLTPKTFALSLSSSSEKSRSDMESSGQIIRRKSARNTNQIIVRDSSDLSSESACSAEKGTSLQNTPNGLTVPRSESSSEEKLRSPKSPLTPEQMDWARKSSPNVTFSRGKENATKEKKWKLGLLDMDTCNEEEVRPFRVQLDSNVKRMTEMCDTWDRIMEHTTLPDAAQDEVRCCVGQARLFMSDKLEQFRSLVERCARPEPSTGLVTPEDLQGFWDLVHIEVKKVDFQFARLTELRARGWAEEGAPPAGARPARARPARARPAQRTVVARKPPARPAGKNCLRQAIAASRIALKQQTEQAPSEHAPGEQQIEPPSPSSPLAALVKTFEAGFFHVHSPVRSPRPCTDAGPATPTGGLRRAVVSSEARKAANASFAMLRASLIGKCDGVTPLELTPVTPINFDATPGRSILRSAKSTRISPNRSVKIVLFTSDLDSPSDKDKTVATAGGPFETAIGGVKELEDSRLATHLDGTFESAMGDADIAAKHILVRQDAVEVATPKRRPRSNMFEQVTPRVTRSQQRNLRKSTQADLDTESKTVKVPSTKKKSTQRRTNVKPAEDNESDQKENEQADVVLSYSGRKTRSNRVAVLQNIKMAFENQSVE